MRAWFIKCAECDVEMHSIEKNKWKCPSCGKNVQIQETDEKVRFIGDWGTIHWKLYEDDLECVEA